MPTQQQVQNIILSAKSRRAALLQENLACFSGGFPVVNSWYSIRVLALYLKAVVRQYNMADYVSANFLAVYDCLCKMLGTNVIGAEVDPNFQAPNTTINIEVASESIIIPIPTNSNGFFDYAYGGSLGTDPTAYIQIAVSAPSGGWETVAPAIILNNGHIYAQADFSQDTYRLVIKP